MNGERCLNSIDVQLAIQLGLSVSKTMTADGEDAFDKAAAHKLTNALYIKKKKERNARKKLRKKLKQFLVDESAEWKYKYKEYLKSNAWIGLKKQIIAERGDMCERCGNNENGVDLHHLTYVRLGSELPGDFKLLCRDCHKKMHPGWSPKWH